MQYVYIYIIHPSPAVVVNLWPAGRCTAQSIAPRETVARTCSNEGVVTLETDTVLQTVSVGTSGRAASMPR